MIRVINSVTDIQVAKFRLNEYAEAMKYIVNAHKTIIEEYKAMDGDLWIFIKQEY